MEMQQIAELIRKELPSLIKSDPEMKEWVIRLTREQYADKKETESRFDRILEELKRDREANIKRWEENDKKWAESVKRWEENDRKWAENVKRWEENDRKWAESVKRWEENDRKWADNVRRWEENDKRWQGQSLKWEEQNRKWEEQNRKWDEQNRKWEANQKVIDGILQLLKAQARKHDSSIGALGARWGLYSEESFRNGLKAILEESFGVQVLNLSDYDESGEVFGHPDQVELDIIIKDGKLILCEIKSSMSKSDIYAFDRKASYYEKRHNQKASRRMVISPMVDPRAMEAAQRLGIEVYSHAENVGSSGTAAS